jgi:asparagine synthetase B (glutamine-hydrolysing)
MIFKQGSCADELFEGMQAAEQEALAKEDSQYERLVFSALQELNAAAESFERAGRAVRAEEVTSVMVALANGKKPEKKKSTKEEKKVFRFYGFGAKDLSHADDEDIEVE